MTALSSLLPASGFGGAPYLAGRFYPMCLPNQFNLTTGAAADRDYLLPFTPRADVTVDEVGWVRANTTAGNVYVGIYDSSGNLLTDCAVDSDTTAGLHAVSTTNVALSRGETYYLALNQSAAVANVDVTSTSDAEYTVQQMMGFLNVGFATDQTYGANAAEMTNAASYKSRSNAALSDPLTLTGFTFDGNSMMHMGIVPA